jgi:hypothetical protein
VLLALLLLAAATLQKQLLPLLLLPAAQLLQMLLRMPRQLCGSVRCDLLRIAVRLGLWSQRSWWRGLSSSLGLLAVQVRSCGRQHWRWLQPAAR